MARDWYAGSPTGAIAVHARRTGQTLICKVGELFLHDACCAAGLLVRRRCRVTWPCKQLCEARAPSTCPTEWSHIGGGTCVVLRYGLRSSPCQVALAMSLLCRHHRVTRCAWSAMGCTPHQMLHGRKVAGCKLVMHFKGWYGAVMCCAVL